MTFDAKERILTPERLPDDVGESSLRPQWLREFIGQSSMKERLGIFLQAAAARGEPLDHVLLYGPPGLGKTTLAGIVAREMGVPLRVTSGPALERPGDLASILTNLEAGQVLFIDEVHRLPRTVEEVLYPAMEDFKLDIVIGKGPTANAIRLNLPRFTIIGSTTRIGLLSAPLRDRFGVVFHFEFYDTVELRQIVDRSAELLAVNCTADGSEEIARRSRGTPRVANRLLKRVRDFAQVRSDGIITQDVARAALELLEVDEVGLDKVDRTLLKTIVHKFGGGPVGLETLAAAISEDPGTIEEVYEPFLMQRGFLARTPRGRCVTPLAYRHLGIDLPAPHGSLFENSGEE